MGLKEILQEDWKKALKAGDRFKAGTITMVKAAILLLEKTNGTKLDDDQIYVVLAKEVKQRKDSIIEFKKGNRQDLVDQAKAEVEILLGYLPQQLTEIEIKKIIGDEALSLGANSIKDMGKVMAAVLPKVSGRADGKIVSQYVKEYLSK